MKIRFLGAARTVTGSMHLIRSGGRAILLDCGLFQGRRKQTYERNHEFPFDPRTIDAVVLSHAHIDHAGNLPNLVRQGYSGPIYCTPATADLCRLMLADSAHIQEKDTAYLNRKRSRKDKPHAIPLYTMDDVQPALDLLSEVPYDLPFDICDGISGTFVDAGHILGSASVRLDIDQSPGNPLSLGFSGDIGRPITPILRPPRHMGDVDVLLSESTYGGRDHDGPNTMNDSFLEVITRTADRGGKIIIPAFSVGRTQDIVYKLNNLTNEGALPDIPVFVDSPLSTNATTIFRKHPECFDARTQEILARDDDVFGFDRLTYIRDVEASKELNDRPGPFIVISASGMCEAGRILHHLRNSVEDPRNTVMIVGYQAEHTLGRKLVERRPEIPIFGEMKRLNCDVAVMNSFSAHADRSELLEWIRRFDKGRLRRVFLVHGDLDQAELLRDRLNGEGLQSISIPERLQEFEI